MKHMKKCFIALISALGIAALYSQAAAVTRFSSAGRRKNLPLSSLLTISGFMTASKK